MARKMECLISFVGPLCKKAALCNGKEKETEKIPEVNNRVKRREIEVEIKREKKERIKKK